MNAFESGPYKICRIMMTFAGLWPFLNSSLVIVQRIVYILTVTSFTIIQIISLYKTEYDITQMVFATGFGSVVTAFFAKYIGHIVLQDKIKLIFSSIAWDWETLVDKKEVKILEYYGKKQRRLCLFYRRFVMSIVPAFFQAVLLLGCIVNFSPPLLDIILSRNTTHYAFLMLIVKYSAEVDENFYRIYIHFFCVYLIIIMGLMGSESVGILLTYHYCAMFQIICYRIRNAVNGRSAGCITLEKQNSTYKKICSTMETYANVTCMFNFYMDLMSSIYFIVTALLVLSITIHLLEITMMMYSGQTLSVVMLNGILIPVHLLYTFLQNHMGQILIDHSLNVFYETCNTEWYAQPLKVQKLLLLVLLRTSKAYVPIVAGIYIPSMSGFAWILNTSFSYFTVMYSIRYDF